MANNPKILGQALQQGAGRKLRSDLTPEQAEKARKVGDVQSKSSRYESGFRQRTSKFIPSKEQH